MRKEVFAQLRGNFPKQIKFHRPFAIRIEEEESSHYIKLIIIRKLEETLPEMGLNTPLIKKLYRLHSVSGR
jgi:hypothetical protein